MVVAPGSKGRNVEAVIKMLRMGSAEERRNTRLHPLCIKTVPFVHGFQDQRLSDPGGNLWVTKEKDTTTYQEVRCSYWLGADGPRDF